MLISPIFNILSSGFRIVEKLLAVWRHHVLLPFCERSGTTHALLPVPRVVLRERVHARVLALFIWPRDHSQLCARAAYPSIWQPILATLALCSEVEVGPPAAVQEHADQAGVVGHRVRPFPGFVLHYL